MNAFLRTPATVASCLLFGLFLNGCRSYNDSAWKTVDFVSSPDRATVFINGKHCGQTPRTERLSRYGTYDVRFSKPGYFDEDFLLEPTNDADGKPDLLGRVEVELVRVTPEALASRERPPSAADGNAAEAAAGTSAAAGNAAEAAAGTSAAAGENGASPAAVEFSKREKPVNFTDFRLQEKALRGLLMRGEITESEYRALHEKLYSSYNENRLLKAPRLGTYEKAN